MYIYTNSVFGTVKCVQGILILDDLIKEFHLIGNSFTEHLKSSYPNHILLQSEPP